jgi:SOS-response transcriptional repressor LexA
VLREPVRLLAPTVESPFAPGREVTLARVAGSLLDPLGVRDGDHVALARRDEAEHGDLAAVVGSDGRAGLWKVYPEADSLRLSTGDPVWTRRTAGRARVTGVVVGVLRKFSA